MQLPEELQAAIDRIAQHSPSLSKARTALTQDYREGRSSPFADEAKRLAYLGARMPATYAAVFHVLQNCPPMKTWIDLGAGPGTGSWAAAAVFPTIEKMTLVEKSKEAILLGKTLAKESPAPVLQNGEWIQHSLTEPLDRSADAALFSYVLNEVSDPLSIVERWWKQVTTLIVIEPGTPKGFQLIRKIRQLLIDLKGHIIAPCPHALACPIQGNDWCHFSARVERTRLHRLLKEGSLGYEDEKFSYLIVSKEKKSHEKRGRLIRAPLKQSGFVRMTLCTETGKIEEKIVTRKEKQLYRTAKDAEWGDSF